MTDNLGEILLVILASIGGLSGLLIVMTALEPTKTANRATQQISPRHR